MNLMKKMLKFTGMRKAGSDSHVPRILLVIGGIAITVIFIVGAFYLVNKGEDKMQTVGGNAFESVSNSSNLSGGSNGRVTNGTISAGD